MASNRAGIADAGRYPDAGGAISTGVRRSKTLTLASASGPVINENDTVATSEIRYGDNDRLAARVAVMMNADLLVLLSDVDGLYTGQPAP
jgi:glutamate 5-kinase